MNEYIIQRYLYEITDFKVNKRFIADPTVIRSEENHLGLSPAIFYTSDRKSQFISFSNYS